MSRCNGKNCKFTQGFDMPHSPECTLAGQQPEKNAGITIINPEHEVANLGSGEYMKLLCLAIYKLGLDEIVITAQDIDECTAANNALCIASLEDGIHLSIVSVEEAHRIAKEQRNYES